jgi:hypothetical protein
MVASISAVVGVVSAYTGYKSMQNQKKAQQKQLAMQAQANKDAKQRQKEASDRADIDMNKANKKKANVSALSKKEEESSLVGSGGTLLTGTAGVDPNKLNLGGNTLLGG